MEGFKEYDAVINFIYNEMTEREHDPRVKRLSKIFEDSRSRAVDNVLGFTNRSVAQALNKKVPDLQKATNDTLASNYKDFIDLVENRKAWDFKPQLAHIAKKYFHKRLLNKKGKASVIFGTPIDGDFEYIYDYDIYSNIHYGYAGRLSNLTWFELELGSRKHDRNEGHSFFYSFINMIGNEDANAVRIGINLFDKKGKLKKEDLRQAIFEDRMNLNRWKRSDLIEAEHVVEPGDTLIEIARINGLPIEAILMKNKGLRKNSRLPVGRIIKMPDPDEIRVFLNKRNGEETKAKEILNNHEYLFGQGILHDRLVQELHQYFVSVEEKEKSARNLSEEICKTENGEPLYYIWETQNDNRVRSSHAERQGKVFCRKNPPEGGNPGEDYGCRCRAIPYYGNDLPDWNNIKDGFNISKE